MDNFFVFGGSRFGSMLGCNVLMMLDLETKGWQHLSGTSKSQADYSCLGPRVYSTSWMTGDRLFIMYGMANQRAAKLHHQPHGEDMDYPYDDMWSFSIHEKKWRNERLIGNPPCPRCESACIYVCTISPPNSNSTQYLPNSTKPSYLEDIPRVL
jgi:hypothetical protein